MHGDPSSALLEVLDPEQNSTFRDNYLGVPFDLSRVVFIGTANVLDRIPGPLRDRMEVVSLPGYTEAEKLEIARRYLVEAAARRRPGLTAEQCEVTDAALRAVIGDYTREAGVRNLEREIGNLFRHAAMRVAEGTATQRSHRRGRRRGDPRSAAIRERGRDAHQRAGCGDRARVDARRRRHPVHRDVAHAGQRQAHPHRAARRRDEGERAGGADAGQGARGAASAPTPTAFEKSDVHMHIPAGAIPKDGPSAGVAMFTSLASLAAGQGRCGTTSR